MNAQEPVIETLSTNDCPARDGKNNQKMSLTLRWELARRELQETREKTGTVVYLAQAKGPAKESQRPEQTHRVLGAQDQW